MVASERLPSQGTASEVYNCECVMPYSGALGYNPSVEYLNADAKRLTPLANQVTIDCDPA